MQTNPHLCKRRQCKKVEASIAGANLFDNTQDVYETNFEKSKLAELFNTQLEKDSTEEIPNTEINDFIRLETYFLETLKMLLISIGTIQSYPSAR